MSTVSMEDDGDDKDDTKRRTRNLSEKKRRDQFNILVHELSTMVSTNSRKMDKSTVLKSAISFLKNHNEVTVRSRAHDVQEDWKPSFLSNDEFTYLMLEALEGFVMVFSSTGRIHYVSESIKPLLGHNPETILGRNVFDFTYEEDRPNLYNLLQRNVVTIERNQCTRKEKEIVMFDLHFKRSSLDFREDTYELVKFNGHFRKNRTLLGDGELNSYEEIDSSILFVSTVRLQTPQLIRDVSLLDPSRNEFTSRHSLEWKFLFLDHRAPPIIGYLPFEVLGTSGYDYYHFDDLEKVVSCHKELMQKGELMSGHYRFLTKGQQWIWLQTRFYITYHQWNSKPEFVMCTNRVVSYTDIIKQSKPGGAEEKNMNKLNIDTKMKTPSEEAGLSDLSPSYRSEASDAFGSSYRSHSPGDSNRLASKDPQSDEAMASASPSYMPEASEACSSYRSLPQSTNSKRQKLAEGALPDDNVMVPMSPSYMSENSDTYVNTYRTHSRAASIRSSGSDPEAEWRRSRHRHSAGSSFGHLRSSSRHSREKRSHQVARSDGTDVVMYQQPSKIVETLTPQHGIGEQYLEAVPYVNTMNVPVVSVPAVTPVAARPVPVIISTDQAQIQEQLQRKHEELQQMIFRQQEELQKVKEQLLLARLGVLQPVVNVPYANQEQMQQQPPMNQMQLQITYDNEESYRAPPPPPPPPPPPHPLPPDTQPRMPQ